MPFNILKMLTLPLELKVEDREKIEAFRVDIKARNDIKEGKRRIKLREGDKELPLLSIKLLFIDPPSLIRNIVASDIYTDFYRGPVKFIDKPFELYYFYI